MHEYKTTTVSFSLYQIVHTFIILLIYLLLVNKTDLHTELKELQAETNSQCINCSVCLRKSSFSSLDQTKNTDSFCEGACSFSS